MIDVSPEIKFQTTRSSGKGGQNVNKVETAVIASLDIETSQLLTAAQKELIRQKLSNRMTLEGCLMVKAQTHRTQLENKAEAIRKINELITQAVQKKKPRIATKPGKGATQKRLEKKKRSAELKSFRQKFRPTDF